MRGFANKWSLAQKFLLVNLVVLVVGMAVIGWWIARQIKEGVISNTAATTALYVDSFIGSHVQELAQGQALSPEEIAHLDGLLKDTPLGQTIIAFKIWDAEGRIAYATDPDFIGLSYPMHDSLARALQGNVASKISDLEDEENAMERGRADQLIETYSPVRQTGTNQIIGAAEFYQSVDDLYSEIFSAQLQSWLLVGVAMLVMYGLLVAVVKPASDVITRQERELRSQVERLTDLLAQNKELSERVGRAATRTTALNEKFLRRISAELHDGPGQDLGLALLRIEPLAETYRRSMGPLPANGAKQDDFCTIQTALNSALTEIRTISAGLRLPNIEPLSVAETVERAVRDYQRKTQNPVDLAVTDLPDDLPESLKMTIYRVIQEALSNGYRHAEGRQQAVRAKIMDDEIYLEVADAGEGFDPQTVSANGHFGLAGMRERVEILGGRFAVKSQPGRGTKIRAYLPLVSVASELV
ncbi:MAG: sensor histidine kinase [Anaerolineae bacterium]